MWYLWLWIVIGIVVVRGGGEEVRIYCIDFMFVELSFICSVESVSFGELY